MTDARTLRVRHTSDGERPFVYQPALDGLRAVAVAGVLAFHQGFSWAAGGFLGVSVFFTLSGYLITGLLVQEWGRTGRVELVQFYDRRIRRLIPAALLCIGFVVFGASAGWWADNAGAITDAGWSIANAQNWNMLWHGQEYADLFVAPSPLTHFWSLAIEEQFYIVWPVALIGLLRAFGDRPVRLRRWLWALTGCAAIVAVGLASWGPNAAYLATPARAAELLAGSALAVTMSRCRTDRPRSRAQNGLEVTVDAGGACGIVRGGQYELDVLNASLAMSCPTIVWDRTPADVVALAPDVVVVNVTLADTWDRSWDNGRTWLTPTDSEFTERISADYGAFVDTLIAAGADTIVWLRPPVSYTDARHSEVEPSFADGGQAVIEAVVAEQAARHPGIVETIDYASWFETTLTGRDRASRPDGIHMTRHAATEAARWLTPQLRQLATR